MRVAEYRKVQNAAFLKIRDNRQEWSNERNECEGLYAYGWAINIIMIKFMKINLTHKILVPDSILLRNSEIIKNEKKMDLRFSLATWQKVSSTEKIGSEPNIRRKSDCR